MSDLTAIEIMRDVEARVRIISGLENVNPILTALLDDISVDVQWLCDRLWQAWATVEAYQSELRELLREDS